MKNGNCLQIHAEDFSSEEKGFSAKHFEFMPIGKRQKMAGGLALKSACRLICNAAK